MYLGGRRNQSEWVVLYCLLIVGKKSGGREREEKNVLTRAHLMFTYNITPSPRKIELRPDKRCGNKSDLRKVRRAIHGYENTLTKQHELTTEIRGENLA